MWYVALTGKGKEKAAMEKCRNALSTDVTVDIFVPLYQYVKRYEGQWYLIEDVLFPGYVFIESNEPKELEKQLMRIPNTVSPVCIGGGFHPVYDEEKKKLMKLMDERYCIRMSHGVMVDERLVVEDGPLDQCISNIIKIDRHKRIAELEIELWKEPRRIKLGLEVKAKLSAEEYEAGKIA